MLYKKYAIEVVIEDTIVTVEKDMNDCYNPDKLISINAVNRYINTIRYFYNDNGYIQLDTQLYTYYTYELAKEALDFNYYSIINGYTVISIKIVEVFDDKEPPITVMRELKIDKIKKNLNNN